MVLFIPKNGSRLIQWFDLYTRRYGTTSMLYLYYVCAIPRLLNTVMMGVDLHTEIPKMDIFLLQNEGSTYTRQNMACHYEQVFSLQCSVYC